MVKIILFGTGSISKLLTQHIKENTAIVAYLTTDGNDYIDDIPVVDFEKLNTIEYDYIVVAFGDSVKGVKILADYGVPKEKIVGYAYIGVPYESNVFQQSVEKQVAELIRDERIPDLFDVPRRGMYLCGVNVLDDKDIIHRDYVREQTLYYLAKEIYRNQTPGNVVAVGVAAGEFERKINSVFHDRKMYLFDTFNGLIDEEKQRGLSLGWGERLYVLGDQGVSEEQVKKNMPFKERCVTKRGHFPESYDLDEKIAFASIDIDFYKTTKKGLEVLYPNLSDGGYIMVHDYNNLEFDECGDAVRDFCGENHISYVPVPDAGGSVIISKR